MPNFCWSFTQPSCKKSRFGLTCNWKFHNIGCVISQCGLKGFFALFWCDHVLRLVFIVKLPFCTLSTFARTVWLAGAVWLWATSIHTLYLNEGVERARQWSESLCEVPLSFYKTSLNVISGNEFDQIMDTFMMGTLTM